MNKRTAPPTPSHQLSNPAHIVGVLLAQGVLRLLERRKDGLDKLTEERVSTGVLTTKENTHD